MPIATLIAADRLTQGDISAAGDVLAMAGLSPREGEWVEPDKAFDIPFGGDIDAARRALDSIIDGVDIVVQAGLERERRLLVADMDSTMITVECLDELADYAGFKEKVAPITERAMRGELDFVEALDERVALLAEMDAQLIARCHEDRVRITPGAEPLIRTMRARGARCLLVSGGFTLFADKVAAQIGFDRAVANRLEIDAGRLTGKVARPIVDGAAKLALLEDERESLGLPVAATMAIGDGANDLAMIAAAGLGVAFRGKLKLRDAADARIDHGDLSALLFAQGLARKDWVQD